ncbi:MAG: hypothetical protein E6J02_04745 [Chloroflexi bacterium]|nr:MAG: hypothetical protein E6J02_04745 [Chloroflexota bacterium]TME16228.1 MAG: hypothetical protein E6I63_07605 [Chloroflexota bacterium]TME17265.1 MAG: hypothetical protein E6I70_11130 [Chloroflexota bacterium]
MKIESQDFTVSDLEAFLDQLIDRERLALAARLEAASAHLEKVGKRVTAEAGSDGASGWTSHEVLAHIAVLSKFYGMLTYKVGSGQMSELDLLGNVHLRDVIGQEMAKTPPPELLAQAVADQRRTAQYLRSADAAALKRECRTTHGTVITADHIARYPLLNHLEEHVEQLERMLPA